MPFQHAVSRYLLKRPHLRRFFTKLLHGSDDRDVNLFGSRLRVNALKENGYVRAAKILSASHSLVVTSELPVLLNLAMLMADGTTLVDVGANVGLYSCTLGRRCLLKPGLNRIYAYEPNPDTFSRLCQSAQGLELDLVNKAVGDRAGKLQFVGGAVSNIFTSVEFATAMNIPAETIEVECCRLEDEPIEGEYIILKIDVEGQELRVLNGAKKWFESGRVSAVYIDGFDDPGVVSFLRNYSMSFFDGATLERIDGAKFNFLALRTSKMTIST